MRRMAGVQQQSSFSFYCEIRQEKRSKNNYRREKIHDPEHAHILSGILKCPCCGKGMYGNIAKAGRKDKKICSRLRCLRTLLLSWQNMWMPPFRIHRRSGWISLTRFRCIQLGLSMADLELLSISLINDMYAESRNDDCKYAELATQEDFDHF